MDINKVIAENLSAWMKGNPDLDTVQKVELKSHVGFGTIRRAKNGEGNITAKNMELIARAFGRQPADLMIPPKQSSIIDGKYSQAMGEPKPEQRAAEPIPLPIKNAGSDLVDRITDLLPTLSERALTLVLDKAKEAAREYPLVKQTPKSFQ